MPRLSNSDYLLQYQLLRKEWVNHHGLAFSILSPTDQIVLHDFFEPSKALTINELKARRLAITNSRPSLPHQAGKAFAHIEPLLNVVPDSPPAPDALYVAKVTSLVNPHIDPARMAQILIAVVREKHDRAA